MIYWWVPLIAWAFTVVELWVILPSRHPVWIRPFRMLRYFYLRTFRAMDSVPLADRAW